MSGKLTENFVYPLHLFGWLDFLFLLVFSMKFVNHNVELTYLLFLNYFPFLSEIIKHGTSKLLTHVGVQIFPLWWSTEVVLVILDDQVFLNSCLLLSNRFWSVDQTCNDKSIILDIPIICFLSEFLCHQFLFKISSALHWFLLLKRNRQSFYDIWIFSRFNKLICLLCFENVSTTLHDSSAIKQNIIVLLKDLNSFFCSFFASKQQIWNDFLTKTLNYNFSMRANKLFRSECGRELVCNFLWLFV